MKMNNILDSIGAPHLDKFIELAELSPSARDEALAAVRYYRGSKQARSFMRGTQRLEKQWYSSLPKEPDYSVYSGTEILPDLWACWVVYSREYLRIMQNPRTILNKDLQGYHSVVQEIGRPTTIADLGCGIGYTSAALTQMFPEAKVYATNLEGTAQFQVCKKMAEAYSFDLLPDVALLPQIDCVFASEYFEHFEKPIAHLREVLATNPKYLILANAFSSRSLGHFKHYDIGGIWLDGHSVGRAFNDFLRSSGYEKVPTSCWNDRPTVWVKKPRYES